MSEPQQHQSPAPAVAGLTEEELDELRAMFELARQGDQRLAHYVDLGLPVNLTNGNGDTLLILAAYHRRQQLVADLVARGADLERVNDRGQTALACAVFRQDEELVRLLLEAGADPDGGAQSANAIASFFNLSEMSHLLARPGAPSGR